MKEKQFIHNLKYLYSSIIPSQKWIKKSQEEVLEFSLTNEIAPEKKFSFAKVCAVGFAILLVFLLPAGIFAKGTVPGDLLYPVKRAIEEVTIAFSFNQEQRDTLYREQLETRIQEFSILAGEGNEHGINQAISEIEITITRLSQNENISLEVIAHLEQVKTHLNDVQQRKIEKLKEKLEERNEASESAKEKNQEEVKGEATPSAIPKDIPSPSPKDKGEWNILKLFKHASPSASVGDTENLDLEQLSTATPPSDLHQEQESSKHTKKD